MPRIERVQPFAAPPGEARSQRTTPGGVVLGSETLRDASRLANYQQSERNRVSRGSVVGGRWSENPADPGWKAPEPREISARQGASGLTATELGDLALRQATPETRNELLSAEIPQNRPYEGPLMTPGRGRNQGKAYLVRDYDVLGANSRAADAEGTAASQDIRGSMTSGDPSEADSRSNRGVERIPLAGNWRERGVDTWTDSNQQNVGIATDIPWVERNGQVGWKTVDSGATAQNIDSTFAGGSKSPIRVNDYQVVEPDSSQTSETYAQLSRGQLLAQLRDEAKTQLVPKSALADAKNPTTYGNNPAPRARVASPDERSGTLVGFLRQNGVEQEVYAPKDVTYTRTEPDGDYRSKEVTEQGFRVGLPTHRDYDGPNSVRERLLAPLKPGAADVGDMDVREALFPGMGYQPTQKPTRIYPAVLDDLQGKGATFFAAGPKGELQPVSSWQEAFALSPERESGVVVAAVQRPGKEPVTLRAIIQPEAEPVFLAGGDSGEYRYTGPAVFSPDEQVRRKGEYMGGSANDQIAALIANAASKRSDIGVGMPGVQAVIERQVRGSSDPAAMEAALLQAAKNRTAREATLQGIASARGTTGTYANRGPVDEETSIALARAQAIADSLPPDADGTLLAQVAPPGTPERMILDAVLLERAGRIPGATAAPNRGIALWQDGRESGVSNRAVDDYNRLMAQPSDPLSGDIHPDVIQALRDEAEAASSGNLVTDSVSDTYASPDSYEQRQGAYGNFGELRGGTKTTISPGELALEEGSPVKPFVEYAMNILGDGDPNRAYDLVDTAMRATRPRAPGQPINQVDVLDAIHGLTGNTVGNASMSKGRRIYADNLRAQYQAPAAGMARPTNYAAYAEALSNPANPNHEAAMALAAQRIRAIRENGLA